MRMASLHEPSCADWWPRVVSESRRSGTRYKPKAGLHTVRRSRRKGVGDPAQYRPVVACTCLRKKRGRQKTFTNTVLQFYRSISCLFGLALRQSFGLVQDMMAVA